MNRRGFTLIELLIVMTLLSLLLVALFGGLRFVRTNEGRSAALVASAERRELTRTLLERQLAALLPLAGAGQPPRLLFTGQPDRLAFPVARLAGGGPGGLMLAVFAIEPDGAGHKLVYREYPFRPGATVAVEDQPSRVSTLLTAATLLFRYEGQGDWQGEWADGARLPRLVALSAEGGPDMVARPRVEVTAK